jgi:hypothetical protein
VSCCTKTGNGVMGYADSRGEWSLYLSLVVRACPIFELRTFIFSVCRLLKQTNADLNGLMFWRLMRDGWMFTGFIVHDALLRFRPIFRYFLDLRQPHDAPCTRKNFWLFRT